MDRNSHQQFGDRLLEQETRVSEVELCEFRRKLQVKLVKAEQRERRMRAVTLGMMAIVLLGFCYFAIASLFCPVGVFPLQHLFSLFPDPIGPIIGILLWTCYLTCAICLIPFLLLYFLHYRRKLAQTQHEQILATLVDLQHKSPSFATERHRTGSDARRTVANR